MVVLILLLFISYGSTYDINSRYFPENFKFGVANAATQIEGAWDEDGKGENIWDHFAHTYPEKISDHSAPDVAADSYHKYKEDVALVKEMGLYHYRLSIAWSRILPTGYPDQVNQKGVDYYTNLLTELKESGIEAMVTLYHWDLPQPLEEELGGWQNSKTADLFAEYANICFQLFGDYVKMWATINEPRQVCEAGYGTGQYAPGVVSSGIGDYICAYNLLLAHAKAYHIYDENYRATQGGRISMVIDTHWFEPGSDSEKDQEASERILQFYFGLYANPIYKGNWPQVVIDRIANRSQLEGYPKSRLPEFTQEQIDYINGTYDYLPFNHYTTKMANWTGERAIGNASFGNDISVATWDITELPTYGARFAVVPWGIRKLLVWLKKTYGDLEIVITENGLSDLTGDLEDDNRIYYLQNYMSNCLDAIYEDGVNLTTYTVWSIIDDWEWNNGYRLGDEINSRYFPKNFKFGVANAATQIEGAWDEDGKGENIWDHFAHTYPEKISDHTAPEIAADSYHKYKEDVALVKAMGLDHYRLSIAWSRILPTGYPDEINQKGIEYYKNLLAELKANDIEPMVTLYHWDLPQPLEEELGGWQNTKTAELFGEYARICFREFGDDIKLWLTINEPKQVCEAGYASGVYAPGVVSPGIGDYQCAYNVLLAHANAFHIYDDEFRATQGGRLSMAIDSQWFEPGSYSDADKEAAERAIQFNYGLYGNPIYKGNWPQIVIDRVGNRSLLEGYSKSRLPEFTQEQIDFINGTYDYLALNHYTSIMVNWTSERPIDSPSFGHDLSVTTYAMPDWVSNGGHWLYDLEMVIKCLICKAPFKQGENRSFHSSETEDLDKEKILVWLKNTYGDLDIAITENGMSDLNGTMVDDHRINYFLHCLSNCLDAIYEDGVNLVYYTAWSIIDDWEWNNGFKLKLGMYSVNFTDPERARTPRKSAPLADDDEINSRYFPTDFKFGVANAATQIEGAWDEDGKGETIWDHFVHTFPDKISDGSTPDVAADSYHKYKEDVALIKAMGLDYYRLSIAWSRILPTGYPDEINQKGVDYYTNLFVELKENGIEPMVTLYHWDLPQPLEEELGGWLNSKTADLFSEYAKICFELFGEYVKAWVTINEPKQVCDSGYDRGHFAPGIVSYGIGGYRCAYNVLLAHAKAYHVYDENFRTEQGGKIAMVLDSSWYEPGSDSEADQEASERIMQFYYGLYANPIVHGNWPQIVIDRIGNRSQLEGFAQSRLPVFTQEEIDYIKGTYDYLALNHYTTTMVNGTSEEEIGTPSCSADRSVLEWNNPEWTKNGSSWIYVVPWGLRRELGWLKKTYGDVEIIITENGLSDQSGVMEDDHRIAYFQGYLSSCLDAIYEDGVNLTAYIAWSIIDDWEWTGGIWVRIANISLTKLGMYAVNFSDPERTRTPRKSASFFTNVVKTRLAQGTTNITFSHIVISFSLADDDEINSRYFPSGFKFGVANAATQIEGAWDEDGKGETIWDHYAHNFPDKISDHSTPDIAADSYHKYKEDVALVKAMGLDYYRLSIAWSRILPTGYPDEINQKGVDYYTNLLTELKENGIEPMVTLYHWDLPQPLEEELGGWLNSQTADLFAEYADICFEKFGEYVKVWTTINEPKQVCEAGYGAGYYAPGVYSPGVGDYQCAYNVLLAHAKAYHIYDDNYRETQGGKVSMVIDSLWFEPGSDSDADQEASERIMQFSYGLYGNPIVHGNWPQVVIDRVGNRSQLEGFAQSRLPAFTQEQIDYIKGTSDYLALNHYSTAMVNGTSEAAIGDPSYGADMSVLEWHKPEWPNNGSSWFYTYLSSCLDAIYEDGVNLTTYVAWSIIDDWEWTGGYGNDFPSTAPVASDVTGAPTSQPPGDSVSYREHGWIKGQGLEPRAPTVHEGPAGALLLQNALDVGAYVGKHRIASVLWIDTSTITKNMVAAWLDGTSDIKCSLADDINSRYFPENFKLGVANAATQIEGAWDEDGKGETIWDHFAHTFPDKISDRSAPDVAADSYHKYKEDVALVKAMGLDYYRLSIAWSRILPTGYPDEINQKGVDYYTNLLAELKENDIEPMVTLYHWDLPQPLEEELGGWLNSKTADLFGEYAKICFELFGEYVKAWVTINEPKQVCEAGYDLGYYAPGVVSSGIGGYRCAYNVLLAHAKALHQLLITIGKIAMVIDSSWYEPGSDSEADQEASERIMQFYYGLYANPIVHGNWPQVVIDRVGNRSQLEGFAQSRLPVFTQEEIDYIKGTYDYLALNHYTTIMVNGTSEAEIGSPSCQADRSVLEWNNPEWTNNDSSSINVVPWGLRRELGWLKKTYGDVEIIITENGLSDHSGVMEDDHRIAYFQGYLSSCLDAIYEDGVNLTAYIAWSIIDDWEWTGGYGTLKNIN
ncbi:hypothetical protein NQ317_014943 [Molorchus minor]|uniref:beta-glucosidase n=1 Tax=Molorchus minor TaxID=1323400 RepID=A0ABQ9K0T7_9CUCU|nr:hypothetical protein NQ317_014943 [Molorchus minor]